eukprot:6118891-Amphidinium_carterae.1
MSFLPVCHCQHHVEKNDVKSCRHADCRLVYTRELAAQWPLDGALSSKSPKRSGMERCWNQDESSDVEPKSSEVPAVPEVKEEKASEQVHSLQSSREGGACRAERLGNRAILAWREVEVACLPSLCIGRAKAERWQCFKKAQYFRTALFTSAVDASSRLLSDEKTHHSCFEMRKGNSTCACRQCIDFFTENCGRCEFQAVLLRSAKKSYTKRRASRAFIHCEEDDGHRTVHCLPDLLTSRYEKVIATTITRPNKC